MREALNGLKKDDRVRHMKSKKSSHRHLVNGIVTDVSLTGKQVYVRWVDANDNCHHWGKYDCGSLEKINEGGKGHE